jgi:hypothetical protein
MAMVGNDLGDAIYTAIKSSLSWSPSGADDAKAKAMWEAVGSAIVTYVTAHASVAVTVTSVTGVTAGAGTSGPGSGTGTVS